MKHPLPRLGSLQRTEQGCPKVSSRVYRFEELVFVQMQGGVAMLGRDEVGEREE